MFIWVGEGKSRRKRGHCLRLCPICHAIRAFTAREVRKYTHIYLIPLGRGSVIATYMQCKECGVRLEVHSAILPPLHPSSDVGSLWELSPPATRAALESEAANRLRLLTNPLGADPDSRAEALVEPFMACEAELASRCTGGEIHDPPNFSRYGALVAFGIALLCAVAVVVDIVDHGITSSLIHGTTFVAVFALIGVGLYRRSSVTRFVTRHIYPKMFRALAPLCPTEAELAAIEGSLQLHGCHVARFGLARRISQDLEQAHRESFR